MAGGALIGALRVTLGLDSAAFENGMGLAQKNMNAFQKNFQKLGSSMTKAGAGLSAAITAPFVALVASSIPAAVESQQAIGQVNAALKSMGPVAGKTSEDLVALSGHLQDISNFDDDDILKKVTANMLTFGKVAGENFDRAQLAAVNLSTRLGQDLQSSAIQVGKALNDPIKGITALRRVGVTFTESQKDQIRTMTEAGNVAGAQAVILGELERQFGGAAKAQRDATPTAAMQQQWRTFQETIGAFGIKVLPPLTKMLSSALEMFNKLSPGAQGLAIGVAAVAAAAGPVLAALGGIVTLSAPLLGMFATGGGLAAGMAALTPILIPLAAAVGGVYLAYKNWDKIGPYIDGVVQRTTKGMADMDAFLAKVSKSADDLDRQLGTPTKDEFFASIGASIKKSWDDANKYDLAAWARQADASIAASAASIWKWFETMHAKVQTAFNAMVDGIGTAVSTRLAAVWNSIKKGTEDAAKWFYDLYDKVVGHSYIPDMVDGIGAQIARLDGVMVRPIEAATKKGGAAFSQMADHVQGLLDRLFPDQAQVRELEADMAALDKALAAKLISPEVYHEARKRLLAEMDQMTAEAKAKVDHSFADGDLGDTSKIDTEALGEFAAAANDNALKQKKANNEIVQSYADMAQSVIGSVQHLSDALKSGDIWDVLSAIVDLVKTVLSGVAAVNGAGSGGGGGGGSGGEEGFATGGSFKVGGASGIDRNLISFKATRGEMVDIRKPGQRSSGGGGTVHIVMEEGALFRPVIRAEAGNVSVETASASQRAMYRQQRQSLSRR